MALKGFVRKSSTFICSECGKRTRAVDSAQIDAQVCARCLAALENENAIQDGRPDLVQDLPPAPGAKHVAAPAAENVMGIERAAILLHMSPKDVRRLLRSGHLAGTKGEDARWTVAEAEVERYLGGTQLRLPETARSPKRGSKNVLPPIESQKVTMMNVTFVGSHKNERGETVSDVVVTPAPEDVSAATEAFRAGLREERRKLRKQYPKYWDHVPEID